jgi:hypothetical protein
MASCVTVTTTSRTTSTASIPALYHHHHQQQQQQQQQQAAAQAPLPTWQRGSVARALSTWRPHDTICACISRDAHCGWGWGVPKPRLRRSLVEPAAESAMEPPHWSRRWTVGEAGADSASARPVPAVREAQAAACTVLSTVPSMPGTRLCR